MNVHPHLHRVFSPIIIELITCVGKHRALCLFLHIRYSPGLLRILLIHHYSLWGHYREHHILGGLIDTVIVIMIFIFVSTAMTKGGSKCHHLGETFSFPWFVNKELKVHTAAEFAYHKIGFRGQWEVGSRLLLLLLINGQI